MTKAVANKKVQDIGCKEVICQILDLLNGETFNDSIEILKLAEFYIKENSFVDAELAKSLMNVEEEE